MKTIRGVFQRSFLLFLCIICNTVMVESAKHLNAQNSIKQKEEEQEDGDAPDLFSRPPAKHEKEPHLSVDHL